MNVLGRGFFPTIVDSPVQGRYRAAWTVKLEKHTVVYPSQLGPGPLFPFPGTRPFPIVIIAPGQFSTWHAGGFRYLQMALAKVGIMSCATNNSTAPASEEDLLEFPFPWLIDFTRVGLIGHSNGGDAVLASLPSFSHSRVCSVLLLAPNTGGHFRSFPYSLMTITPALDGAIARQLGAESLFNSFTRCVHKGEFACHLFVSGTNHSFWDSKITDDDSVAALGPPAISSLDHQGILRSYAVAFFRQTLLREPMEDFLSGAEYSIDARPEGYFGATQGYIRLSTRMNRTYLIVDFDSSGIAALRGDAAYTLTSLDTIPGYSGYRHVLEVNASSDTSVVGVPLSEGFAHMLPYSEIRVRLGFNGGDSGSPKRAGALGEFTFDVGLSVDDTPPTCWVESRTFWDMPPVQERGAQNVLDKYWNTLADARILPGTLRNALFDTEAARWLWFRVSAENAPLLLASIELAQCSTPLRGAVAQDANMLPGQVLGLGDVLRSRTGAFRLGLSTAHQELILEFENVSNISNVEPEQSWLISDISWGGAGQVAQCVFSIDGELLILNREGMKVWSSGQSLGSNCCLVLGDSPDEALTIRGPNGEMLWRKQVTLATLDPTRTRSRRWARVDEL
jgi:hypothetical protein